MRISTNTIFDRGTARMGELQTGLAKTQQQVSTGRRITAPSDDPVASARALEVTQAQEVNAKFAVNRRNAKDALSTAEGALQTVTRLMQDVKTLTVAAGNGVLTDTERGFMATELQGYFEELIGLANTRDGVGNYVFSGYQTATPPFAESATGAQYAGDQGDRVLQVHNTRQIEVGQNGYALFERISSSGTFASAAAASNGGSGAISNGSVVDASLLTGQAYSLNFSVVAGVTTYDIVNTTTSVTVSSGNAYVSGQPIVFDGLQFEVSGAPAHADRFTVQPTGNQSIFTTLKNLITALQTPANSPTARGNLAHGLSTANDNIDSATDHVLTARAAIGASLKEIDSLDALGEDVHVQYALTLSELQDLDYVQAITDLMKQQNALQAAQQSFMKVTSLSLFNFL